MKTYYVGMDVHRASIVIVVLNGAGKVVERSVKNGCDSGAQLSATTERKSVCDV